MSKPKLWLNVPGAKLLGSERRFLRDSARLIQKERGKDYKMLILNIGVMWGASMHCLRKGAPRATLVGLDIDFDKYKVHNREELRCIMVKGDSTKIHSENDICRNMKIDLLFIDGSHKYKDVKADIAGWVPKVLKGGMVIFHDYKPAREDLKRDPSLTGVKRAVDEWHLGAVQGDYKWYINVPGSLAVYKKRE